MSGLVKNEMIKTGKSGLIRAAICVILAICILLPIGNVLSNTTESDEIENNYLTWAENSEDEIEKMYYSAMSETAQFFIDNSMGYGDWRYDRYYGNLSILETAKSACILAANGVKKSDAQNYFTYEEINVAVDLDENGNVIITEDNYADPFEMNGNELSKAKENIEKYISELKKIILTSTIFDMYKQNEEFYRSQLSFAKKDLKEAEEALKKNPDNIKLEYARDRAKGELETDKLLLWGAEQLKNGKFEFESWQYNTINNILANAAYVYSRNVLMSEQMFLESDEARWFKSYKEYADSVAREIQSGEDAIAIIKYSLENNIPVPEALGDSAKNSFIGNLGLAAMLVGILMVAVAGSTLFNEYSSGSIRLLLIRPKSRSKILLSKLITVIIFGAGTMVVSAALLFVLNMFCHADRDMFTPFIMIGTDGAVRTVSTVSYALVKAAARLFSSFAVVSGAFMLSAIFAKGGIFSLMAGPVALAASAIARSIAAELNTRLNGLAAYTVLPYLDLSAYISSPVSEFSNNSYSLLDELFGTVGFESMFNPKVGTVIVAVHIAVFLIIAFIGFGKKQIKN